MTNEQCTRMEALVTKLNDTSALYYHSGDSPLTDAQWDALYDELVALEKQTATTLADSPTIRVGAQPLKAFVQHTHISRLWSMDKVKSTGALSEWLERCERLCREAAFAPLDYAVEYKLDGLTINLTYRDGLLVQAAKRGDGEVGDAILPQARTIRSIPLRIPYKGLLEVQGECIMRLSVLDAYNKTATETFKNARNAAAGALSNLDPGVTAQRKLDAFFYQIGTIEHPPYHDQRGMLRFLQDNGFMVSPFVRYAKDGDDIIAAIREVESERDSLDYLIDGAVVKVTNLEARAMMGHTEKFPRWAIAFKFPAEESTATLLDVTWELGRTGKLTPRAHLTPTDIAGVTVQHATLNNLADIRRKGVAIGCTVRLRRSNDVIPEITGRIGAPAPDEKVIEAPKRCPACGEPLVERGAHLFCMNRATCKPQAVARLAHFAGRSAMDVEGFSEKTAELLYDQLGVRDPADLFRLTENELLPLEGFQQKRAANLVEALAKSRDCALDAFIFAIGIPNVGRKTARDLAECFRSLAALREATQEQLTAIPDVGEIVAGSIVEFFSFDENNDLISRLLKAGVAPRQKGRQLSSALAGQTIVVTGTLPTLSREEAEALIVAHGGRASGSVSKKTSFVLAGEKAGSKLTKARELKLPVLDESAFLAMLLEEDTEA